MRRWLKNPWFRGGCAVVLMLALVAWVDPRRLWASLVGVNVPLLLLGCSLTPAVILVKVLRWWMLAGTQRPMKFREALSSYLAGLAAATVTPLAAGEVTRGLFVRDAEPASLTGKVVLDKIIDLSTVAAFAGLGLAVTDASSARLVGLLLLASIAIAWCGLMASLGWLSGWSAKSARRPGLLARVRLACSGLASTPRAKLAMNAALSLVGFSVFYAQVFLFVRAFWPGAPWAVVPYFPIVTLSTILPIGIGGVGIREWTAMLLLGRFGIAESVAVNAFFLHFVALNAVPALAGVWVIASFRRAAPSCSTATDSVT